MRVAEESSFTGAAQRLQVSTAQVSRAVAALETYLRTRLFNRTAPRIALTEAGERYLRRCEQILACIDQPEAGAADPHARPSGRLRVHATTGVGQTFVVPAVVRYQQCYPSVSVELTLSQQVPDLLDDGYDVSLQLSTTDLPDSGLASQQLGIRHSSVLCASPAYLRDNGVPRNVSDLGGHTCPQMVTSVFPHDQWHFDGPDENETFQLPAAGFQRNVAEAVAVALREGVGIGALPRSTALPALRSGALLRVVMPDHTLQAQTAYALYESRQYVDAKIKAFGLPCRALLRRDGIVNRLRCLLSRRFARESGDAVRSDRRL